MNKLRIEDALELIEEWGLVSFDRICRDFTEKDATVEYVELYDLDNAPNVDKILSLPFLTDFLITHIEIADHGDMTIIHRNTKGGIVSFPFVYDDEQRVAGWVPTPVCSLIADHDIMTKPFLPWRLSDGYARGVEDSSAEDMRSFLSMVIAASLSTALDADHGATH